METTRENPACPDYMSHFENATERLFPAVRNGRLSAEQDEAVRTEAEAEFQNCEGH